jgi:signal transduction histidine kinase
MDLRKAEPPPMPVNRQTVLIVSSDPAFARELATNWPGNGNVPEFTVLAEGLFSDIAGGQYDLVIADGSTQESRATLKPPLVSAGKPAILIHSDSAAAFSRSEGSVIELRRDPSGNFETAEKNWSLIAGVVGREILRRLASEARQHNAETKCAAAEAEAVLGRYMIEMRHNVNNALTSVLGNAELLTLEPGLPAHAVAQADTVRNMALRLHEVFQRFSSIEKELSVAARESSKKPQAHAAASAR